MATEFYAADKKVYETMFRLIREDHPELVPIMDKIVISFRTPPSKAGGKPSLGKHGKVSAAENARHNTDYIFFIELSWDHWQNDLDSDQQEALLFHHLCGFGYEPDGKSDEDSDGNGEYKPVLRGYDVIGYREEFERYGIAWRPEFESDPLPVIRDVVQKKTEDTVTPKVVFSEDEDDPAFKTSPCSTYKEVQGKLQAAQLNDPDEIDGIGF